MVEEAKPRFVLSSAAELLARPEPQIEWLIENIWTDKSRGLIAGNPGVGKTWLALDMLLSVATGGLCLGKFASKKSSVLLVEEEGSELNLSRRLHCMARARNLKDSDLTNLFLLTRQFVKIPADAVELFHLIEGNDIKLVVFDSLRRFHDRDENSSSDMQEILDSFSKLNTLTGASIVLIHHLAKSNDVSRKPLFERLRGSSDFWAWRDCLIGVEGEEESHECTVSFQFRDAESPQPIKVRRVVGSMSGAIALEALEMTDDPEFTAKCQAAIEFVNSQFGGAYKSQIATHLEGRKTDNLKAIRLMEKKGILVAEKGGKLRVPDFSELLGTPELSEVPNGVP